MPIVNADVKGLEFRVAAWYGQDKVALHEIANGIDPHSVNQLRFNFPDGDKGRVAAKRLLFKWIYGGTPFGFSVDPEFDHLGYSEKRWESVLSETTAKYAGIDKWHGRIIHQAKTTGTLETPSGRVYHFHPEGKRGNWPEPKIKNYPVQGLGADIVALLRIGVFRRLYPLRPTVLLINTVHDSIMVDCKDEMVDVVCKTIHQVAAELPKTISRCFGVDWQVPMAVEISSGANYRDQEEIKNAHAN